MKKFGFKLVPIVLVALLALPAAAQAKEAGDSVTKGKGHVKEKSAQSTKMNAQWSRFGVLEWDDKEDKIKDTNPNFDYELVKGEDYRDLDDGNPVLLNVINRGGNIVKTINYPSLAEVDKDKDKDEDEKDVATGVSSIEQPVWSNERTANADEVNEFIESLWEPNSVFEFTNEKLVVDTDEITPDMLTFIDTNWGGSSVPVKLIPDGTVIDLAKDANWDNSYLDWIRLSRLKYNGEVEKTIGGITYTIKYVGGINR